MCVRFRARGPIRSSTPMLAQARSVTREYVIDICRLLAACGIGKKGRRPRSIRYGMSPPSGTTSMSGDLVHPDVLQVPVVLEGIGEGKVRVNSASLDHLFLILAGGALEIVGIA